MISEKVLGDRFLKMEITTRVNSNKTIMMDLENRP